MLAASACAEEAAPPLQAQVDQAARTVLQRLVALHGITTLLTALGDFLIDGHVTPGQVSGATTIICKDERRI